MSKKHRQNTTRPRSGNPDTTLTGRQAGKSHQTGRYDLSRKGDPGGMGVGGGHHPSGGSASGWEKCPRCGQSIKSSKLATHIERVHEHRTVSRQTTSTLQKKRRLAAASIALVSVILISVSFMYLLDRDEQRPDPQGNDPNWLESYTPQHTVGPDQEAWWIEYPDINPDAGDEVEHVDWLVEGLSEKPVVVFVHSDDCAPCVQQKRDINTILETLGDDVLYYDLPSDGSDQRAYDVFERYDPNGGQHYIPLTVLATLVEDDTGNVRIAWHGSEGATGEEMLDARFRDAIYYHHRNRGEWDPGE